jgi:hypothetical protein
MRKAIAGVAALSLSIGVGAGVVVSPTKTVVRTESVASSAPEMAVLPAECRSAMELAATGLGAALQGFGAAQSAVNAGRSVDSASSALGVLGQSNARVQGVLAQYNQARAACDAAAGATSLSQEHTK